MVLSVEQIARVAHEANASYCCSIGDFSQPSWLSAPEWQKESAVKGVLFHLEQLAHGVVPTPSASHESWLEEKQRDGWKYGPIKNAGAKEHPCCVPYDQLPVEERRKDYLFGAIVSAFYRSALSPEGPVRWE